MSLKKYSISIAISLLASCAHGFGGRPPRNIKVYMIESTSDYCDPVEPWCQGKVGLVRKQNKEVKSWLESDGYLAVSPADFNSIISSCPSGGN